MIYYGLDNILCGNDKIPYNIKNKTTLKKDDIGLNILTWTDLELWGMKMNEKEFVMYSKIKVFDEIPKELALYINKTDEFIYKDSKLICKVIGRYKIKIKEKIWILDVIFPRMLDESWTDTNIREYTSGNIGIHPTWRYNLLDSNMIEFTMNKINRLNDRSLINIIRFLISEMSSSNSVTGLIEARWEIDFPNGKNPMSFRSPSEIFKEWSKKKRPVKYGQCWIFAECMTTIFRFLGISTRTIFAENSHVNTSLNCGIDMMLDCESMKDNDDSSYYFRIDNISDIVNSKANPMEDCILYNGEDSIWNMHYWNEIYIPDENNDFSWNCIDSTPCVETEENPYKENKILGPCKVSDILSGLHKPYDYKYLHSVVNSPFRMWSNECITVDGTITIIPVLKALIFPFYHDKCIGTSDVNIERIKNKLITINTKVGMMSKKDITDTYTMDYNTLYSELHDKNPLLFENKKIIIQSDDDSIYYVQQICLDKAGKVVDSLVQNDTLKNITYITSNESYDFISVLIVLGNNFWIQLFTSK